MDPELKEKLISQDEISADFNDYADFEANNVEGIENCKCPERAISSATAVSPMNLTWNDITVFPKEGNEKTISGRLTDFCMSITREKPKRIRRGRILDNAFGAARSGEVLALMGASGAGKTSLLNILTHRNLSTVNVEGHVKVNGIPVNKNQIRKMSAYVQQDDLFIGTMTVMEHLKFVATLKMGRYYTKGERERRVWSVMNDLGLIKCANTLIGTPHRSKGLSGGERKRVAFAAEILTSPPLLFCDEPTSGLDAFLAQQVVQVLKQLAKNRNMTVVLTIHQPSSQVFELFDKVCLLADGRTAFLGSLQDAESFWTSIELPLPLNFNPGDHFISTLTSDNNKKNKKVKMICDSFESSDLGKQLKKDVSSAYPSQESGSSSTLSEGFGVDNFLHSDHDYRATWWQQFVALTKRSFLVTIRDPVALKVKLMQTIIISLILGLIYFNTPVQQKTIMNINGLLFQAANNMNFMFQFAALGLFCSEYPIFLREHLSGFYRVDTYFLAKNVAELVQYIIYPLTFSLITYWMSGLYRTFWAFSMFTINCILMTNTAVSVAYAMACIFPQVEVATAVMPIIVIPLLAFGGFFINQNTLPIYFMPLKYLSYFGYVFENMAITEWQNIDYIPGCDGFKNTTCLRNGHEVLESLSFAPSDLVFNISALLIMIVGLRVIAWFALFVHASQKN